jgi:hypothetical protein
MSGIPGFNPIKRRTRSAVRESRSGVGRCEYADGGAYPGFLSLPLGVRSTVLDFCFLFFGVRGGLIGNEDCFESISTREVAE